ncbi:hypothetical protein KM043_016182 [Ampulex compressa]|nr:hypothetical protein KM043_016182 [Ampulex compressa]
MRISKDDGARAPWPFQNSICEHWTGEEYRLSHAARSGVRTEEKSREESQKGGESICVKKLQGCLDSYRSDQTAERPRNNGASTSSGFPSGWNPRNERKNEGEEKTRPKVAKPGSSGHVNDPTGANCAAGGSDGFWRRFGDTRAKDFCK